MDTCAYDLSAPPDQFGCRRWLGKRDRDGYGVHGTTKAHIASWREAGRAIPDGHVIDHVCRVRSCVRLVHLEAVTETENQRRKQWPYRARRERCAAGHDLRVHSVVLESGGRVCRRCNVEGP